MSNPRHQCSKCPWKIDIDPHDIPNGYCETLHKGLKDTIAGDLRVEGALRIMACHESAAGKELPCVGWLKNQLGPGNNILLRLAVIRGHVNAHIETVGEQHEHFEDTLPKEMSTDE